MKKEYMTPAMLVVELQHKRHILTGSEPRAVQTNFEENDALIYHEDSGEEPDEDLIIR